MFEQVQKVLSIHLGINPNKIHKQSLIGEELGIDSLDLIGILLFLEENQGIELSNEDFSSVETVEDVVILSEKKGEKT